MGSTRRKICVLGAGSVGLNTALKLQERLPDADIILVADKFTIDTLSTGAGGIFRVGNTFNTGKAELTKKVVVDSFNHYKRIQENENPRETGVMETSGYAITTDNPDFTKMPLMEDLLPIYRPATEQELSIFPPYARGKETAYYSTYVIDSTYHLPYMMKKFQQRGGKVVKEDIKTFSDLEDANYDIVVNCSGFKSRYLCNDKSVVPLRGQLIKVKAPWIKMFYYHGIETYIIPGVDYVSLGGTREYDSYGLEPDKHATAGIWDRCTRLIPNLKHAQIERVWVGLRPHRKQVRMEKEVYTLPSGNKMKIVHNYGHCGYGISVAPGCAIYVSELVLEFLAGDTTNPEFAKL